MHPTMVLKRVVCWGIFMGSIFFGAVRVKAIEPPRCALLLAGRSKQGANNGTATYVTMNNQLYIVTAYHNLYNKYSADLTVIKRNGIATRQIYIEDNEYFDPSIYYDTVNDLAVLKIKPDKQADFQRDFGEHVTPIELYTVEGATSAQTDPPKGSQGISIGNPRIGEKGGIAFSPQNVVYSCTIAEYEVAKNRINSAMVPNLPESIEAANNEWLFVEAMSIAEGFSGGPIIVSDLALRNGVPVQVYRLAGVVSGGSPLLRPGRFAWASRSSTIRQAIQTFEQPRLVNTGRTGKLPIFPLPPGREWPVWPYNTQHAYTFDHQRFFTRQTFQETSQQDCETLANFAAHELIFHNCDLIGDVFGGQPSNAGAYLANATFTDCRFFNVKFDHAILTGAIFHNCDPAPQLQELLKKSMSHGASVLKGPELLERPPIENKPTADEEFLRELKSELPLSKAVEDRGESRSQGAPSAASAPAVPSNAPSPRTTAGSGVASRPTLQGGSYRELMDQEKLQYRNILKGP